MSVALHLRPRVGSLLGLALLMALLPGLAREALAHGIDADTNVPITQTVGPYELTVTLDVPSRAATPLQVSLAPHSSLADAVVALRVAPVGAAFTGPPGALLQLPGAVAAPAQATLPLAAGGAWELELRIDGPRGPGVARLSFVVGASPLAAGDDLLFAALAGFLALFAGGVLLELVRGRRGAPVWLRSGLSAGLMLCALVAVGIYGYRLVALTRVTRAAARPPLHLALHHAPARAAAPLELTLELREQTSGALVDDLAPHHEALLHLIVISADGTVFAHLHPARQGPGRFASRLTLPRPGRYTAYAEVMRRGALPQTATATFTVAGVVGPPASPLAGLGLRRVADLLVDVSAVPGDPAAADVTLLRFRVVAARQPGAIQPWLGATGHLIMRSADGAVFGHLHAATAPADVLPAQDGAVAVETFLCTLDAPDAQAGGDTVTFAVRFPQPGRYQLWAQFRYADRLVTVPLALEAGGR